MGIGTRELRGKVYRANKEYGRVEQSLFSFVIDIYTMGNWTSWWCKIELPRCCQSVTDSIRPLHSTTFAITVDRIETTPNPPLPPSSRKPENNISHLTYSLNPPKSKSVRMQRTKFVQAGGYLRSIIYICRFHSDSISEKAANHDHITLLHVV